MTKGFYRIPKGVRPILANLTDNQYRVAVEIIFNAAEHFTEWQWIHPDTGRVYILPRGCFVSSQRELADQTGCSRIVVRLALRKLKSASFLAQGLAQGKSLYLARIFPDYNDALHYIAQGLAQGLAQGSAQHIYKDLDHKNNQNLIPFKKGQDNSQLELGLQYVVCANCFRTSCADGTDPCERPGATLVVSDKDLERRATERRAMKMSAEQDLIEQLLSSPAYQDAMLVADRIDMRSSVVGCLTTKMIPSPPDLESILTVVESRAAGRPLFALVDAFFDALEDYKRMQQPQAIASARAK